MFGPYDVLVLVILAVGYFAGRSKGFAWQVSGIATLVVGFVAAAAFTTAVAPLFPDAWPAEIRRYAAWSAIYVGVTVVIYLATMALSKKLKQLDLEELDRRFGGALGAVKAGLLVAVLSLAAVAGSERARVFVQESTSGLVLEHVGTLARPLLPEKIGKALDRSLERLDPHGAPGSDLGDPEAPITRPLPTRPQVQRPPVTQRLDGSGSTGSSPTGSGNTGSSRTGATTSSSSKTGPNGVNPRPAPTTPATSRSPRPAPVASPEAPISTDTPAMDDENAGDDEESPPSPPSKRPSKPRADDEEETPAKPEPRDPLLPR